MPAGHAGGILSRARVHARLVSIELTLVIGSKEKIHGSESTSSYFVTMAANLHPHGSESTSTWQRIYIHMAANLHLVSLWMWQRIYIQFNCSTEVGRHDSRGCPICRYHVPARYSHLQPSLRGLLSLYAFCHRGCCLLDVSLPSGSIE